MAQAPPLTDFDRRVLRSVPEDVGIRTHESVKRVTRKDEPGAREGREIYLVLRGLEHLGLIEQRGGWWRRKASE